jgi:hypothetical protein
MNTPSAMSRRSVSIRRYISLALCAVLLASTTSPLFAQKRVAIRTAPSRATAPQTKSKSAKPQQWQAVPQGRTGGVRNMPIDQGGETPADGMMITDAPVEIGMRSITAAQTIADRDSGGEPKQRPDFELEQPDRKDLPEGAGAQSLSQWPPAPEGAATDAKFASGHADTQPLAPQVVSTQFDGATGPTETGAFPPDTQGAIGPTQFFVFLNGRMRTFNKTTGVADGVINADPDVFFASVITPPGAGEVAFTSDPQVRYDRLSGRWFLVIIDVVLNASTGATTKANRVLIAASDAASAGVISGSTVWTLYQFQGDATLFTDYESLGIDANALYIGGDMFTLAGAFNSTKGFVIPKAPLLTASPATVWAFSGLVATPTGAGPFAPRGVDNYNPANTGPTAEGYFIGVDNATFNTLMLRRVTNPSSLGPAPTISANISIATPLTTRFPVLVPHLGNTGGTNGRLDSLDDRLYAAHIRNGRLWTAHSIGVNNTGVAGATNNRDAARWYELQNVVSPGTPSVLQSGTLFDNNAVNDANQRNYWIPTIMVSGQGHAALGMSIAGTNERVNAFTTGRLVGDTLGTLRDGPGGAALPGYTATATAYNPPGDPGGPSRRWGDYSATSLDPKDDMTMWTIQEYCNGTNTYGVRVAKLLAPPPPPTATAVPATAAQNNGSTNVVVTGVAPAGQGYYDPGANLAPPALPFNHVGATATGGVTVNSVTYTDPTHVTLNVSTVGASLGPQNVTITNPDGQNVTYTALITVTPPVAPPATAGQVIISEFRFRGPASAADEFVELYNTTNNTLDISGFTLWALTGAGAQNLRFTVPGALGSGTTTIPAHGHYLITGASYTLPAASNGSLSTGIVDGSGVAFFAGATPTAPTRIDSAGFDTRDALFFEGTAITPSSATGLGGITVGGEYSFVRKMTSGFPQDTGNNDNDFAFVSTNGATYSTRLSTLGAPSPENLASPVNRFFQIATLMLDPNLAQTSQPNRARDINPYTDTTTPSSVTGAAPGVSPYVLGTLSIRRRFVNNTGAPVTKLRFRIVDITTFPVSGVGVADVRALSSSLISVTVNNAGTCSPNPAPCSLPVQGTTLEQPPTQAMGGGLNSALLAGTVTAGTPLANGASVDVQFLLGVAGSGSFRFFITIEALP